MAKKIISIILVIILIAAPVTIAALSLTVLKSPAATEAPEAKKPISLKDIYLPDTLRDEGIGLFFLKYEDDGEIGYYKSTSPEAKEIFDPAKPLIIYSHGMGMDYGRYTDEGFMRGEKWVDAGYNTAIFNWCQFADDVLPFNLEEKMWGTDGKYGMKWIRPDGEIVMDDVPNVPLAKIFAAFYFDFMADYPDFSGREIWFTGHSMGGQVALAAASYILSQEQEGAISASLLPDRVTLYDPYFSFAVDDVYVDWLDRTMGQPLVDENGEIIREDTTNAEFAAEVAAMIAKRGIAIEIIPTVTGIVPAAAYHVERGHEGLRALYAQAQVLAFRTDWVADPIVTDFNEAHNGGRLWYPESLTSDFVYDSAMENSTEYTLSAKMPLSVIMARRGVLYEMQKNYTQAMADDVIYSTNIDAPYVAGFAFWDENGNGAYDERIQGRAAGVKVELYLKSGAEDRLIGTAVTDGTGFYKIEVPTIYANGFDQLYVKAVTPSMTSITRRADKILDMNNDINPDTGKSDLFIIPHRKSLIIINTGLRRG